MDVGAIIEATLEAALQRAGSPEAAPPQLAAAMHHAVFPGGARIRPRLTLGVALACGNADPGLSIASAAAIELMHCASLVHDDLPCFDDSPVRRGRPSVHALFGSPIAVLAGDALIVLAFEVLGRGAMQSPAVLPGVLAAVARGAGMPFGIVAGQAWESEPEAPAERYRLAKTAALFVAATTAGALAGGGDPGLWRHLGHRLGEAYQVADDLLDAVAQSSDCDKPVGRDVALGRPSAVCELGLSGAVDRLQALVESAVESIPPCPHRAEMQELVRLQAMRLAPKRLLRTAA